MTSHLVLESSHHMFFFAAAQCKMWKAVQLVGCRGIGKEWTSFIGMTKNNSMHRVVPTLTKCDEVTRYRTAVQTQTQEAFCFLDALFWLCLLCTADLSTCTGNLWGFQICVSQMTHIVLLFFYLKIIIQLLPVLCRKMQQSLKLPPRKQCFNRQLSK